MTRTTLSLLTFTAVLTTAAASAARRQLVYVTNFGSASVSVIESGTDDVIQTITVGDGPLGIAAARDGRFVYVADFASGDVAVIRTDLQQLAETIPVDGAGNSIAVTPDGRFAYVTNTSGDSVAVIDTGSWRVIDTIAVESEPAGIGITADGAFAYVANYGSDSISIIDTATRRVVAGISFPGFIPHGPLSISFADDASVGYVTTVVSRLGFRINPEVFGLRAQFNLWPRFVAPEAVAVTPDGSVAYIAATVADSETGVVIAVDLSTNEQQGLAFVGRDPEALAVTPDNRLVYVANAGADTVSVVTRLTDQRFETIAVGHSPMGVAAAMVPDACIGDCSGDGFVTMDELVRGIGTALSDAAADACPTFDAQGDGRITIDELVAGVNNALRGCPDE